MIDHPAPSDARRLLDRRPVSDRDIRSMYGEAARDRIGEPRATLGEVGV